MNTLRYSQVILGYTQRGIPIWSLLGAEDDGTGGQSAPDSTDTGQSAGEPNPGQSAGTVSQADYDRIKVQLQAADQKRQEAENARKALEDAKKDDLTRATDKSKELEQSVQGLQDTVRQLTLENAFLRDSTYQWHDPADVLLHVRGDDTVTIGDDGKVSGMEAALKNLATKKPYLVKPDVSKAPPVNPSGDASNGGNVKNQKAIDDETLKKKYAALRR